MEKTILCYGDSNTWGFVPQNLESQTYALARYSREERWTGLLQKKLGNKYYVVEEGLNGRTTNIDYQYPPDRNGKTYLLPCLYSHAPINLVIFLLGGNDCKSYFNRSANEIRQGMEELIDVVQTTNYGSGFMEAPKVLILTQPIPFNICEKFQDENRVYVFEGSIRKAKDLVGLYMDLAKRKNCYLIDISEKVKPSDVDGMHFNLEGHKIIANLLYTKILEVDL